MSYTVEDFKREVVKNSLHELSVEERLDGLSTEDRLRGLRPEDRLKGMKPEDFELLYSLLQDKKSVTKMAGI